VVFLSLCLLDCYASTALHKAVPIATGGCSSTLYLLAGLPSFKRWSTSDDAETVSATLQDLELIVVGLAGSTCC